MLENALIFNAPPEGDLYQAVKSMYITFLDTFSSKLGHPCPPSVYQPLSGTMDPSDPPIPAIEASAEQLKSVLDKMEHKFPEHLVKFRFPMLPTDPNVPNYYQKIDNPMCLSIVRSKLDWGAYSDAPVKGFTVDVRQIWRNGQFYWNDVDAETAKTACRLWKKFEKYLGKANEVPVVKIALSQPEPYFGDTALPIVQKIMKEPHANLFASPVTDEIAPGYSAVVKEPMDLGTIQRKLQKRVYKTPKQFVDDIRRVWNNCRIYNHPTSAIVTLADTLSAVSERMMADALFVTKEPAPKPPRDRRPSKPSVQADSENDLKKVPLQKVITKLEQHQRAGDFCVPLDPAQFGYEEYDKYVFKRMDLQLLRKNVSSGLYADRDQFACDLLLPFENAIKYPGTPMATRLAAVLLIPECKLLLDECMPLDTHYENKKALWITQARKAVKYLKGKDVGNLFQVPVDPLFHGITDYFERVTHPMDLQTISRKLNICSYHSKEEFVEDVKLVFNNCVIYHSDKEVTRGLADKAIELRDLFLENWSPHGVFLKAVAEGGPDALQITKKIAKQDKDGFFLFPVDVVANPLYGEMIKEPMDLGNVLDKLESGKYDTWEQWKSDVDLVWANCRLFNAEGTEVRELGEMLAEKFEVMVSLVEPEQLQASIDKIKGKGERAKKRRVPKSFDEPFEKPKKYFSVAHELPGALTYSMRPLLSAVDRQLISQYVNEKSDWLKISFAEQSDVKVKTAVETKVDSECIGTLGVSAPERIGLARPFEWRKKRKFYSSTSVVF